MQFGRILNPTRDSSDIREGFIVAEPVTMS